MRLFLAVPVYRSEGAEQVAFGRRLARDLGVDVTIAVTKNQAVLHLAHAHLMHLFLQTPCDAVLMMDDDVSCAPEVVGRMIAAGVPAVVAPYLVRGSVPERFDAHLLPDGSVETAGLGLALVRRPVIERLWLGFREELGCFDDDGRELVCMFRDFFGERGGRRKLLRHDHAFWCRVRAAGFAIEALDGAEVTHAGAARTYRAPRVESTLRTAAGA